MTDSGPERRRALVVTNSASAGPGRLAEWLPTAGLDLDVAQPWAGEPLPPDLAGHDALLVLGGPQHAYEPESMAWSGQVARLLRDAVDDRVPVLAVCLGAQLLAEATGGTVEPGQEGPELGARLVGKRDVAGADPFVWDTPMSWICVQWHGDAITELPPGAVLLASSPRYPHQAFRLGDRAWGLQFHIEPTPDMVRGWAADSDLLPDGADPEPLVARTLAELDEVEQLWRPACERFAAVVRGEDPRPRALPLA
ncbi:MAG: type 1 glutamine amidotransferase [Actinomycetota bacterium]|nr:type 1 glutamine amidotransferase [Actinomycetota bacterium]